MLTSFLLMSCNVRECENVMQKNTCLSNTDCPQGTYCNQGVCTPYPNTDGNGKCLPGFADCDALVTNGCEINLVNDSNNCGACGNVCTSGKKCVNGVCQ